MFKTKKKVLIHLRVIKVFINVPVTQPKLVRNDKYYIFTYYLYIGYIYIYIVYVLYTYIPTWYLKIT